MLSADSLGRRLEAVFVVIDDSSAQRNLSTALLCVLARRAVTFSCAGSFNTIRENKRLVARSMAQGHCMSD
eukprot:11159603-Lingulodinium_polyedra.AAC.1